MGEELLTTKGRKASEEKIKESGEKIKIVEDFMKAIEQVGGKVPQGLKKAVDRYLLAMKMGLDAAEAANHVSRELEKVYEDMYSICREKAGMSPGQPGTWQQMDEFAICQARVDRQWQARNVQKVLDWNDDSSWVSKVWDKWWKRLLDATDFGGDERKKQNLHDGTKVVPN